MLFCWLIVIKGRNEATHHLNKQETPHQPQIIDEIITSNEAPLVINNEDGTTQAISRRQVGRPRGSRNRYSGFPSHPMITRSKSRVLAGIIATNSTEI